jgi:hypothetical protein
MMIFGACGIALLRLALLRLRREGAPRRVPGPYRRARGRAVMVAFALAAGQLTAGTAPAAAHAFPINTVMNAFVKIEPKQAQLVVRIPMDLLPGLPFPLAGPHYDLAASGTALQLALLTLPEGFILLENGVRLTPTKTSGRLSPPADRSFESYETAATDTDRPTNPGTEILYDQGYLDIHFTYPISSPKSVFKIQTQVAADIGDATRLVVRYLPLDESSRAMIISGGSEPVALNPAWYVAASTFVELGIEHILSGIDHLLFLFCLVIPFRRVRGLFSVITAFTVAHSITLFASAFHLAPRGAWFPPLVEIAIAVSIVYMALENLVHADLRRRWLITGMFGLVHGFGFSDTLEQSLQFAGSYLLVSLFSFNIGIEIGQLCALAVMLPALALLRRMVPERKAVVVLSLLGASIGTYWMIERWQALEQAEWPNLDASRLFGVGQWAVLLLLCFGAAGLTIRWTRRKFLHPLQEGSVSHPENGSDYS